MLAESGILPRSTSVYTFDTQAFLRSGFYTAEFRRTLPKF